MKRILAYLIGLILLGWLLIPTTDIVSPEWSVLVTDQSGQPIQDASVSDFAQQYTLESNDHEQDEVTDANGRVKFDSRRIRANGLRRILGVMRNIAEMGAHAGFGVHTHIHAFKTGYGDPSTLETFGRNERESTANGSATQSSHVILQKCAAHYSGFGCDFPDDPSQPVLPLQK